MNNDSTNRVNKPRKVHPLWLSVLLFLLFSLFFLYDLSSWSEPVQGLLLPSIIGNNMILQQQTDAAIWGWDKPGTTVTISFRENKVSTQAQLDGKWMAKIPSGAAGRSFALRIEGTNASHSGECSGRRGLGCRGTE
jgi:sialate O-acetylesterase